MEDIKFNSRFLKQKKIIQIILNRYMILIVLEDNIRIEVGSKIELYEQNSLISFWDYRDSNSNLTFFQLLEVEIENAQIDDLLNLSLKMSNSQKLKILNYKDNCESYIIYFNGDFQVVP